MEQVPLEQWQSEEMRSWSAEGIDKLLTLADQNLRAACARHRLDVQVRLPIPPLAGQG